MSQFMLMKYAIYGNIIKAIKELEDEIYSNSITKSV